MELDIVLVVLVSAALHPLWNALIKQDARPEGAFIGLNLLLMAIAAGHTFWSGADLFAAVQVWHLIVLSAFGQSVYGVCLVMTLRRGDLSAYYPIVRSSPIFIVTIGFLFLGERYPWPLLAGIALVLSGGFVLLSRRGVRILDDPVTLGLSILAMSGVGIYSLADSRIVQYISPPVLFFWVQIICFPIFITFFWWDRGTPRALAPLFYWVRSPLRFLAVGGLAYLSYYLILVAYGMGGDVAIVTSVRQVSIPFSVLIGGMWLKEKGMLRRLWGSVLLSAGLVIVIFIK